LHHSSGLRFFSFWFWFGAYTIRTLWTILTLL
jgi:hypothetical protein